MNGFQSDSCQMDTGSIQSNLLREAHFFKSLWVSEALEHTIITVPKAFPAISMLAETTRTGHTCPTWTESGLCNKSKGKVKQYKKKLTTERTTLLLYKAKFIRNAITLQRWQQHTCLLWRQAAGLSKTDIFRESSSCISSFLLPLFSPLLRCLYCTTRSSQEVKLSAEF